MRKSILAATAFAMAPWLSAPPSSAGIATDGTVGPRQTLAGPNFSVLPSLGRQVGPNLFHSFDTFNLSAGETATFTGPGSVRNVLARVTGGVTSSVNGTLACPIAGANLYLINPSGVIFGAGAALDVQGSFAVTTADFVKHADGNAFHASDPSKGALTAAAPAAFGFLARHGPAPSIQFAGATLAVPSARVLTVASAGGVTMTGGKLAAPAGRVNLIAPPAASTVALDPASLDAPVTVNPSTGRGPIALAAAAEVNVDGPGGGRISVNGGAVTATAHSDFRARTTGAADGRGIDVNVDSLDLASGSQFDTGVLSGSGRGGDITVKAGHVHLDGADVTDTSSGLFAETEIGSSGPGGHLTLDAGKLDIGPHGQLSTRTSGTGAGGNLTVTADRIRIDGGNNPAFLTGVFARTRDGGAPGGNLSIAASEFEIARGGQVGGSTLGAGNAGNLTVNVANNLTIDGTGSTTLTGITSNCSSGATGKAGPVGIAAGTLTLRGGAEISSGTSGAGDAGSVAVRVAGAMTLDGTGSTLFTGVSSQSNSGATGKAGSVTVSAGQLAIRTNGEVSSDTFGPGNAGSVGVTVTGAMTLDGGGGSGNFTGVSSDSNAGATGNAGAVAVSAGELTIRAGAQVSSDTFGAGNAGSVSVAVSGKLVIDGSVDPSVFTGISSDSQATGPGGSAGSINVRAAHLSLLTGGEITSDTLGLGNAGRISVRADTLRIDGMDSDFATDISSDSLSIGAGGKAGSVTVTARTLTVLGAGAIDSSTSGLGDAGALSVKVTGRLTIDGLFSGIFSDSGSSDAGAGGRAGTVTVSAGELFIGAGSSITSDAFGTGNAGDVSVVIARGLTVNARGDADDFTGISSSSEPAGPGGNAGRVTVRAGQLSLLRGGELASDTFGLGNAGQVSVVAGTIRIDRGGTHSATDIASTSQSTGAGGRAGSVVVTADRLTLRRGAEITSGTFGNGDAGAVTVNVAGAMTLNSTGGTSLTGVSSQSNQGATGRAGSVTVKAGELSLLAGGEISSSTFGAGDAGAVTVNVTGAMTVDGGGGTSFTGVSSQSNPGATGKAGSVTVSAGELAIRGGSDIVTGTFGPGAAGTVSVAVDGAMTLDGGGSTIFTSVSSQSNPGSTGKAGSVTVSAGELTIRAGSGISSSTFGTGAAGTVSVTVASAMALDGNGSTLFTNISSQSNPGATGRAGSVTISAGELSIRAGAYISSSTSGLGDAGTVSVTTAAAMTLDGTASPNSTGIFSQSNSATAGGKAGSIVISAGELSLRGHALISSSTSGLGDAGSVAVIVSGALSLDDDGTTLLSGIVSRSNSTTAGGKAGSVTLSAADLSIVGGAEVSSGTVGSGDAGEVRIRVANRLEVAGADPNGFTSGIVAVSTGSGHAGQINIATGLLSLADGGRVSSRSDKSIAGDVTITARQGIALDDRRTSVPSALQSIDAAGLPPNTQISAFSQGGDGGNVTVITPGFLVLSNSLITGRAQGSGAKMSMNPGVLALNRSVIDGRANGRRVDVAIDPAAKFLKTDDSRIIPPGIPTPPDIDISGSVVPVRVSLFGGDLTLQPACPVRLGLSQESSFLVIGRGGQPVAPGGLMADLDRHPALPAMPAAAPSKPR